MTGGQFRWKASTPRDEILIARNQYWGPPSNPASFSSAGAGRRPRSPIRYMLETPSGVRRWLGATLCPMHRWTARIVTPRVAAVHAAGKRSQAGRRRFTRRFWGCWRGPRRGRRPATPSARRRCDSPVTGLCSAAPAMSSAAALVCWKASGLGRHQHVGVAAPSVPDSTTTSVAPGRRKSSAADQPGRRTVNAVSKLNDPTSVAVANTADQLRDVGIAATVLALDPGHALSTTIG